MKLEKSLEKFVFIAYKNVAISDSFFNLVRILRQAVHGCKPRTFQIDAALLSESGVVHIVMTANATERHHLRKSKGRGWLSILTAVSFMPYKVCISRRSNTVLTRIRISFVSVTVRMTAV